MTKISKKTANDNMTQVRTSCTGEKNNIYCLSFLEKSNAKQVKKIGLTKQLDRFR